MGTVFAEERAKLGRLLPWLSTSASSDPARVFRLDSRLTTPLYVEAASRLRRKRTRNTPGLDGQRFDDLTPARLMELCADLAADVRSGRYRPSRQRLVDIPKDDGGARTVCVLSVGDRIVVGAQALLLDPILDADISPQSMGGRRKRSVRRAVHNVMGSLHGLRGRPVHFVRSDVAKCFDRIPHNLIMGILRRRVRGRALLTAIEKQLSRWESSPGRGVGQGSPLATLLANRALGALDDLFDDDPRLMSFRWVDDTLVIVRGPRAAADEHLDRIKECLGQLGLEASPTKSLVTSAEEGADFLGLRICRSAEGDFTVTATAKSIAKQKRKIDVAVAKLKLALDAARLHGAGNQS